MIPYKNDSIFVIDTNVFVHAANCKEMGTTTLQSSHAKLTLTVLIEKCYPFLFSHETLKELKFIFSKIIDNNYYMDYDVIKMVDQNILYSKSERTGGKKGRISNDDHKSDEIEDLISDPSDRKFIYLLRDYNFHGDKFLISGDRKAFFPADSKIKSKLSEYQRKYGFQIISTGMFAENIYFKK